MKINELIQDFKIYMTNEEKSLYDQLDGTRAITEFNEREQVIMNNLIRKSLVSKIHYNNRVLVAKNEH
jgi:hypothetical protein